jgi:hypothetical protein
MSLIDGIANALGVMMGSLIFRLRGQFLVDWISAIIKW